MAASAQSPKPEPLKTATAAVGLLTGIVAAVYVLGGLVFAIRLQATGFSNNAVATTVGQLPRELVISTAMLNVLLPATLFGLVMGIIVAVVARGWGISLPPAQDRPGPLATTVLLLVALALLGVSIFNSQSAGEEISWVAFLVGGLFTACAVFAAWHLLRRIEDAPWVPAAKLGAAGVLFAAVALAPSVLLGATLSLEPARVCLADHSIEEGLLLGEGGGRVLLAHEEDKEASVLSLPSDRVVKTEYGDFSFPFVCPAPST